MIDESLFSEIGWRYAQMFLHKAAEVGGRGEFEKVGDFSKRHFARFQQPAYVDDDKARNPVIGCSAAYALAHLREIFRRYAQFVGIIAHLAVLYIIAVFEHLHEAGNDVGVLKRDVGQSVLRGVDVEEVEKHHLRGTYQYVFLKGILGVQQPLFYLYKVLTQLFEPPPVHLHDRISIESQRAFDSIVAAGAYKVPENQTSRRRTSRLNRQKAACLLITVED